ncbi:MAG: LamG-like jellyroll fold domain-containing protein [Polyangiales bacterium]
MFFQKDRLQHIQSVSHEGKVLLFGTDSGGDVWYTVRQDGFEDNFGKTTLKGWEDWQSLEFPGRRRDEAGRWDTAHKNEREDPSVVAKEKAELTRASDEKPILRSRYSTFDQTAVAPVQLVSGSGHVYVFRQSKEGTLLVDRFVLDGARNRLVRKLEVRFKRSRQRYEPMGGAAAPGQPGDSAQDSPDFRDINGQPFFEPTTEISWVNELKEGWFSVVRVVTNEHDRYRWHIFAYNKTAKVIEVFSVAASEDGLFDVADSTVMEPSADDPGLLVPRRVPGILRRSLALKDAAGNDLAPSNGFAATRYDLQQEQETADGPQLLRGATRVMLVVPTQEGSVALSFAVAGDGTLSRVAERADKTTLLRGDPQDVLLPPDLLDGVRAFSATPPLRGKVSRIERTDKDDESKVASRDVRDRVKVHASAAHKLADGDVVRVTGTASYDGFYKARRVDNDVFEIDASWVNNEMGEWERVDDESPTSFDGLVTSAAKTADGKLRVTAPRHGLADGDEVQLRGTKNLDSSYVVTRLDANRFIINCRWPGADAVNLKLDPRRRRCLVLAGGDNVELSPASKLGVQGGDYTVEAWVWLADGDGHVIFWLPDGAHSVALGVTAASRPGFAWRLFASSGGKTAYGATALRPCAWYHVALRFSKARKELSVLLDGALETTVAGVAPFNGGSVFASSGSLRGRITDVRVWRKERSDAEVRDARSAQFTGREQGLAALLPMGELVADGATQRVNDLSPNAVHGVVRGAPVVSSAGVAFGAIINGAAILARKLRDDSPAVKYGNDALFAVRQRATYEETFEFRAVAPAPVDANKVDGVDGQSLFAFSYWGKKGRDADERVTTGFGVKQADFEALADGWYRASCTVTIPDGVALIRQFEISDLKGATWTSLEVRRHRVRLISQGISEEAYTDAITLQVAGLSATAAADKTAALGQKERELSALQNEKTALVAKLSAASNSGAFDQRINDLRAELPGLRTTVEDLRRRYEAEAANPLNSWCKLRVLSRDAKEAVRVYSQTKQLLHGLEWNGYDNQWFKFVPYDDGYLIYCLYEDRVLDNPFGRDVYANVDAHKKANQQWRITRNAAGYFEIRSRHDNTLLERASDYTFRCTRTGDAGSHAQWQIDVVGGPTNSRATDAQSAWSAKAAELSAKEYELAQKEQAQRDRDRDRATWEARVATLNASMAALAAPFEAANGEALDAVRELARSTCAMPVVRTSESRERDGRGLQTLGAQLAFVRAATRVSALETCEGDVRLAYFDAQGRARTPSYVAVSDGRGASEQWVPEGFRACLTFSEGSAAINFKDGVDLANRSFTVEFWARRSESGLAAWALSLSQQTGKNKSLSVGFNKGDAMVFGFQENDLVTPGNYPSLGWHHWACVFDAGLKKRAIYRDGFKVAEDSTKDAGPFDGAGDLLVGARGAESFRGALSELRVWSDALTEDEVNAHARSAVTGCEPGLLAWFPLSEGAGDQTADRSVEGLKKGRRGDVRAPTRWRACTAPLGVPNVSAVQFNGSDNVVDVAATGLRLDDRDFTIEAWVKPSDLTSDRTIVGMDAAGDNQALHLMIRGGKAHMGFYGNDTVGSATLQAGLWCHVAFRYTKATNEQAIFINGVLDRADKNHKPFAGTSPLRIGAWRGGFFKGSLADVRVWAVARTEAEIRESRGRRMTGAEAGLMAYFPLNHVGAGGEVHSPVNGVTGTFRGAAASPERLGVALVMAEYSTVRVDPATLAQSALLRRFFASPSLGGVELIPDKRVEELDLRWVGNAQFRPTLLGYIEGAPPVPSENLTEEDDYNGATSIELTQSNDVTFSWERTKEYAHGFAYESILGGMVKKGIGVGVTEEFVAGLGLKTSLSLRDASQNATNVSTTATATFSDRLALRGTKETDARFPAVGKRFVPKNVGYALVVSGLADVYVTRLKRSGRMISYEMRPNRDFPPDVNTVTFLINPAYTMQGSLDGMTGSQAASRRFYKHVPEMRLQYGSRYAASYFRLQEAYALKAAIEQQDKARMAFYQNFDSTLTTVARLEGEMGAVGVQPINQSPSNAASSTSGATTTDKDKQAAADKQTADAKASTEKDKKEAEKRDAEMKARQSDVNELNRYVSGTCMRDAWQTRMEGLRNKAGKRNIVNTYVWDADGGLRTEKQEFASTVEHTIGGSFNMDWSAGLAAKTEGLAFWLELSAVYQGSLSQTMSKTESYSQGFSLEADLEGVEGRGVTDYADRPIVLCLSGLDLKTARAGRARTVRATM